MGNVMDDRKIVVIVAMHKTYRTPTDSIYYPLHVGRALAEEIGIPGDNTGDNISCLNSNFCELTGMYWAWKNVKSDYVGLVHYRRYFCLNKKFKDPFDNILTQGQLRPILKNYSVIVPKKRQYYIETLYSHYAHTFQKEHLDVARDVIRNKFPEFLDSFDRVMKRRWGYMFNMMIMEKRLFDEYCFWLFSILFAIKQFNVTPELKGFEGRFYGRISERLFNVWLEKKLADGEIKREQLKELPWIYTEKINVVRKIASFLMAKFLNKKYGKSF